MKARPAIYSLGKFRTLGFVEEAGGEMYWFYPKDKKHKKYLVEEDELLLIRVK
ncbi:hypothetical protein [Bacillus smithii]|uniref:hypothetical protein n=1 Tax=Bacillus smithii TaxID=1479 RepID=UPI003D1CFC97